MSENENDLNEDIALDLNINRFPTHIAYTDNKVKPNKYVKINGQTIYNGKISRFNRNILMRNMHDYLVPFLEGNKIEDFPIKVCLTIRTVINHGDIQRRADKKSGGYRIIWNKPDDEYEPTSDLDNIGWIWIKAFNDALKKAGVISDDNFKFINGYSVDFEEVENLDDRQLNFKLIKGKVDYEAE